MSRTLPSASPSPEEFQSGEHILLKAEDPITVAEQADIEARWLINHAGRGTATELAVTTNGVLRADSIKKGKRVQRRWINLRFVEPTLTPVGRVDRRSLGIGLGFAVFAVLWGVFAGSFAVLQSAHLPVAIGAATAAFCTLGFALHRSFRGLRLITMNGGACVLEVTVAVWPSLVFKEFGMELPDFIDAAFEAYPQEDDALLRDEMRDHHRLKESGVLTAAAYEKAKQRILQQFG